MASSRHLLQLALPLVPTHGFTRNALSLSVLSLPQRHEAPLSETAVSALFGDGDDARRTLVRFWLDDAVRRMKEGTEGKRVPISEVLKTRLKANEDVLAHLPEAFSLLATPGTGIALFDPRPAVEHAARIANEACHLSQDTSAELSWYTRRAIIAVVYTASELHQLASPQTAYTFLDNLLSTSSVVDEIPVFASYIGKSWKGILKSSGIF